MAEQISETEKEVFERIVRLASYGLNDAVEAKRLGTRDEVLECLRQALQQIGRAFLYA